MMKTHDFLVESEIDKQERRTNNDLTTINHLHQINTTFAIVFQFFVLLYSVLGKLNFYLFIDNNFQWKGGFMARQIVQMFL